MDLWDDLRTILDFIRIIWAQNISDVSIQRDDSMDDSTLPAMLLIDFKNFHTTCWQSSANFARCNVCTMQPFCQIWQARAILQAILPKCFPSCKNFSAILPLRFCTLGFCTENHCTVHFVYHCTQKNRECTEAYLFGYSV